MSDQTQIKLISNQEIDQEKWDQCIEKALNKRIYSRSWYLDQVAENWSALVYGDYEYVMAIPVRKKYGIKYIYQPTYCQQLGIFPSPPFEIQKEFASIIRQKFRLVSYQINNENSNRAFKGYQTSEKVNLCLPLQNSFDDLFSGFTQHTRRNIKTAEKNKVSIIKGLLPNEYLTAKRSLSESSNEKYLTNLNRIIANTVTSGKGVIYAAYSSVNNLCAAALILFDGGRAYYLNAFSTDEGKENRAMYAIVNELIREFAGTNLILDFEGSNIEGIARFYKGFGAVAENYSYIYSNRLPVVRWFK